MAEIMKLKTKINSEPMAATVETITPEMAFEMLMSNPTNRPMNRQRVMDYAKTISEGHWRESGESIIIAKGGDLLDGQHRLEGCCVAKMPIVSVVVRNVDANAFQVIDTGMRRTVAQILKMQGEHYTGDLGSCLSFLYGYEQRNFGSSVGFGIGIPNWIKFDILERHPDIRNSVKFIYACAWVRKFGTSRAVVNGIHYLATQKHGPEEANRFIMKLNYGTDLPVGDPILTLREFLIARKAAGYRLPWGQLYSAYRKAWDAYILEQSLPRVKDLQETMAELQENWEPM